MEIYLHVITNQKIRKRLFHLIQTTQNPVCKKHTLFFSPTNMLRSELL